MSKVILILAEGFESIEVVVPIDILRRAGIEVILAGLTDLSVTSAQGITVTADILLSDVDVDFDAVVVPGGPGASEIAESEMVEKILKKAASEEKIIAAICAAPAKVLNKYSLLAGRKATCFTGMQLSFNEDVKYIDAPVVVDGNIVTGKGAGASLDFAYKLVEILVDKETACSLSERMVYQEDYGN